MKYYYSRGCSITSKGLKVSFLDNKASKILTKINTTLASLNIFIDIMILVRDEGFFVNLNLAALIL